MIFNLVDKLQKSDNLSVQHKGTVVDNNDPEKNRRVKCVVPGIIEGKVDDLPWCNQILGPGLGGRPDCTESFIPENGSELVIVFPFGDPHIPYYTGVWQSGPRSDPLGEIDYPETVITYRDKTGNFILVNKKEKYAYFQHSSGSKIQFTKDGDIHIYAARDLHITAQRHKHEHVVKNRMTNIDGSENLQVGMTRMTTVGRDDNLHAKQNIRLKADLSTYSEANLSIYNKANISIYNEAITNHLKAINFGTIPFLIPGAQSSQSSQVADAMPASAIADKLQLLGTEYSKPYPGFKTKKDE